MGAQEPECEARQVGELDAVPCGVSNTSSGGMVAGSLVQVGSIGDSHGYASSGVHIGDVNLLTGAPVRTRYRHQVQRIAPPVVAGRESELAELAEFCTAPSTDGSYAWWRGEAWSGKSALMSWFVLYPPERVRVVSFFVTARWAGQGDRSAFIDNVMEQLLAMLGEQRPSFLTEANRETRLLGLLEEAAQACRSRDEHLVLLIDGLDEDQGVQTGPDTHSIAALLPSRLSAGLRIIVSGRPSPPCPADVPAHHPLRNEAIVRVLAPSPAAQAMRGEMIGELKRLFYGSPVEQDLLGLITAAGGGLTAEDLAELTGLSQWQIDEQLRTVTGRSFACRDNHYRPGEAPEVYLLGHEELQHNAVEMLGTARMEIYRGRLHTWAQHYRDQHWPADTPEYLVRGYYSMLAATGDLPRMVECATDTDRQEHLLDLSGADIDAMLEIISAQDMIAAQEDPDLLAMVRLAIHRDRLCDRSNELPRFVTLWARLGRFARAETLAYSIPDLGWRARELTSIATEAAAKGDRERAVRLLAAAENTARSHEDWREQQQALGAVAVATAQIGDLDRAEGIALSMEYPPWQARTLAAVLKTDAATGDTSRSLRLVSHIENVADSLTDGRERCGILIAAAEIVADADDAVRALELIDKAEQAANQGFTFPLPENPWELIALVVDRLGDSGRAEILIQRIDNAYTQVHALFRLIDSAIRGGDSIRAAKRITMAEAITGSLTQPEEQMQTFTWLAVHVAENGDHDRAVRLLAEAVEMISSVLTNQLWADSLLREAAQVAAIIGDFDYAETLVHYSAIPAITDSTREWVARNIARAGHLDRAQALVNAITEPTLRTQALTAVAEIAADHGDIRRASELTFEAEATARCGTNNVRRVEALVALALTAADLRDFTQASELLGQGEKAARSITYVNTDRHEALMSVINAAIEIGHLDHVYAILGSEPASPDWVAEVHQSLIGAAIRAGDFDRARVITVLMPDLDQRANMLHALAAAVADDGDLDRARSIALSIAQPGTRVQAMASVVTIAARNDATSWAVEILNQIRTDVQSIETPAERVQALADMAEAAFIANDIDGATELITQAREAADFVSKDFGQPQLSQGTVAKIAARVGMLHEAESIAESIDGHFVSQDVWEAIAESVAATGNYSRARQIANRQNDPGKRVRTLARVIATAGARGNVEEALDIAAQAERLVFSIASVESRDRALVDIVSALASVGDYCHGHTIASAIKRADCQIQALTILSSDPDPRRRSHIISQLLRLTHWHLPARKLIQTNPNFLPEILREFAALPKVRHSETIDATASACLERRADCQGIGSWERLQLRLDSWLVATKQEGPPLLPTWSRGVVPRS